MDVDKLVTDNLDLPRIIYWELVDQGAFGCRSLGQDDGAAYGNIGLVIAAKKWNPNHPNGSNFRTYAKFWIVAYIRRAGIFITPLVTLHSDVLDRIPDNQPSAQATVGNKEQVAGLLRILPKRLAGVLRKRYLDGCLQTEIANEMGVTRQRVEQLEKCAIARLRKGVRSCQKVS